MRSSTRTIIVGIAWIVSGFFTLANAVINIEITHGSDSAVPIAIMPFDNTGLANTEIGEVIRGDLGRSGRFKPLTATMLPPLGEELHQAVLKVWRDKGVDNLVRGRVIRNSANTYDVEFELVDVYKIATSLSKTGVVENGELVQHHGAPMHVIAAKRFHGISPVRFRALGHHISDLIYEALTGVKGHFSTSIAYILVHSHARDPKMKRYILEVADYDGQNPRQLVSSSQPMMSPAWSHDGKRIAYVSFENKHSEIYVVDVASGRRELLTSYPGINGAPAWSPDGRYLAFTLSKDGSPHIYRLDLVSKQIQKLTDGLNIDTEPAFEPSGKGLIFTSNRSGGNPHLFRLDLASGAIERVTFEGNYNARGSYTADGKHLVMLHRGEDGIFRIASQELATGRVRYLTHSGKDESPSLAPNGNMVIYGTQDNGRQLLGAVSMDGKFQLRLPAREGSVQEPAWAPFSQ